MPDEKNGCPDGVVGDNLPDPAASDLQIDAVVQEFKAADDLPPESPPSEPPPSGGEDSGGGRKRGDAHQSTRLRELVKSSEIELWMSTAGEPYATIPVERADPATQQMRRHFEDVPIDAKNTRIRDFLVEIWIAATGNHPGSLPINETIDLLRAEARKSGREYQINVRVGERSAKRGDPISEIWIDIGDRDGRAFRVTADGWCIEPGNLVEPGEKLPVKFLRTGAMEALPIPPSEPYADPDGGEAKDPIWLLQDLLNPKITPDEIRLIAGWIIGAFHPRGPYPVLAIEGEQGSGKSSLTKFVRLLTDPSVVLVHSAPKDIENLSVHAENTWVVSLDNQSAFPQWLSDGLCRLSTGGGMSTREFYTNKGEVLFNHKRPALLNAIIQVASSNDLADRCIMIKLKALEGEYIREAELDKRFDALAPHIMAAVLDGLSSAIRNHTTITPVATARMVDFATWVEAAAEGLGFEVDDFANAYRANRGDVVEAGISNDPVASAIVELMRNCQEALETELLSPDMRAIVQVVSSAPAEQATWPMKIVSDVPGHPSQIQWRSTPTELLTVLKTIGGDRENKAKTWPSPNSLWGKITRAMPLLRKQGIEVTRNHSGDRSYTITCPYSDPPNVVGADENPRAPG